MPVRTACEQEEYVEKEIYDMSLPTSFKAKESVPKDEIELQIPEMIAIEITELPKEVNLEMPIMQIESETMQNVSLVSDVPAKVHVGPSRKILGKRPKLHTKQKKVLGSKVDRRANPTKLLKRVTCRPLPKPPDNLNDRLKASKRRENPIRLAKIKLQSICGPPPKPPDR